MKDFFCLKTRNSIEIDGRSYDSKFRTEIIKEYGIHELRFTNEVVMYDFDTVKKRVAELL